MRHSIPEILAKRIQDQTIRHDTAQIVVAEHLETLRTWLEAHQNRRIGLFAGLFARPVQPPKGIYLWGGVGRGKSMLMDLFAENTDIPQKRRVHFHAFMQETHHALHDARQKNLPDALTPFADAIIRDLRLLALDEMQIADITDAMIVGRLFQKLIDGGVVIVTTSNRPPEELYQNGLNRALFLPFVDLLRRSMHVTELDSPHDYRQNRPTGPQVYYHPAGTAKAQIDALWRDVIGTAKPAPLTLSVNGRNITLATHANGAARASFWDLCAKPLGPADFLAIADALRVLVLEDIPQLSASNYNEAKRFVILIDALYERRTRLICSAADLPERLYLEGAGSFEFARTASRLREMQHKTWPEPAQPM